MIEQIRQQLEQLFSGQSIGPLEEIRNKAGVHVWRAEAGGRHMICKYFEDPSSRREIQHYALLRRIGVPVLETFGATETLLCLEDVDKSQTLRLGNAQDLRDETVSRLLAGWYLQLHESGAGLPELAGMYCENTLLDPKSLRALLERFPADIWSMLLENREKLEQLSRKSRRTLVYNDFFWTNLIVRRDYRAAFMFDYNLLGAGYPFADIRNVCSSLSPQAGNAFRKAYGPTDPWENFLDSCLSPAVTLQFCLERDTLPEWGQSAVNEIRSPDYLRKWQALLQD